jgi:transcriptional regulator with PAS, ATPase and Fis domain
MAPVSKFTDHKEFLKNLFNSIPCGVLIVDSDRRVMAVNDVLKRTFGLSEVDTIGKRGGEALRCIHSSKSPDGCGYAEECRACKVRQTALEAIGGRQIHRKKAKVSLYVNGQPNELDLLVSASPFEHENKKMAIVMLEDITELSSLRRRLKTEQSFAGIIGGDHRMNDLFETIRQITDINVPVLIQGESGTGKELVAAAIHNEGPRADKLFVPVNCAALPEGVLESELFGHVKGAFTGAIRDKRGRFELADGGTLFLDEVAEMPMSVQVKLLRVIQEKRFERVGGEKTISVDVRLISATNKDLKRQVDAGNFRDDLYYRLKVVPINIPPLRDRKGDIPLLSEHFIKTASGEGLKTEGLSDEALRIMIEYAWPGNVRELQSAIRFSIVKSGGGIIRPEHLPIELNEWKNMSGPPGSTKKLDPDRVREALTVSGGNKAKAARLLGVGRATLYRFLANYPDMK